MTLEDVNDKDLLRGALYAAVRLAITRHSIELEPDTATEEEVAEDAAGACFGEECCQDIPIPEVAELLRRLAKSESAPPKRDVAHEIQEVIMWLTESEPKVRKSVVRLAEIRDQLRESEGDVAAPPQEEGCDEATEKRWQDAIYELCKSAAGRENDSLIDGGGTDSGDALDFTLTEIGQAIGFWRDKAESPAELVAPPTIVAGQSTQTMVEALQLLLNSLEFSKIRYSRDHGMPEPTPAFPVEVVFSMNHWAIVLDAQRWVIDALKTQEPAPKEKRKP